jgi:hypothetical protein
MQLGGKYLRLGRLLGKTDTEMVLLQFAYWLSTFDPSVESLRYFTQDQILGKLIELAGQNKNWEAI